MGGEPGTPGSPLQITDPRMLRALAHPARIAILQRLALDGPATATGCAALTGLSPSACSYHLRALATHGFVEPDPASAPDGRHRPWRARIVSISYGDDPEEPAAVRAAGEMLAKSFQQRFDEVRAQYYRRQAEFPPEWRQAAGLHTDVLHVSAAELAELKAQITALLASCRRLDPPDRPPDSHRVQVVLDLVPWLDPEPGR
jgi:DNA-binding transcriptional ArsR family regulator